MMLPSQKPFRLAYLVARIELYHAARLNALHDLLGPSRLGVAQLTEACLDHPVGTSLEGCEFRARTLFPGSRGRGQWGSRSVKRFLDGVEPDVVAVTGYDRLPMRRAAAWARRHGAGCVLLSDSQEVDRPRKRAKEAVKAWWIRRHVDSAFVAGARSATYLRGLGVPVDRIWLGYDVVDNGHLAREAERARRHKDEVVGRTRVPCRFFLFVGRLAVEKNVEGLLAAYARYRRRAAKPGWGLVVAGSGPREARLRELGGRLGLRDIVWPGYISPEDLPGLYARASALVLPSHSETWGLVVNEAMACGLPVLVSRRCGCVPELVQEGANGWTFDPDDDRELASLMARLSMTADLEAMGETSRRLVEGFTPATWAASLNECAEAAVEVSRRRG